MPKIPVGKTISHAFLFTLSHFTQLLRITAGPVTAYFLLTCTISLKLLQELFAARDATSSLHGFILAIIVFLILFLGLLQLAIVNARIIPLALGLTQAPRLTSLEGLATIFRLYGTYLLSVAIIAGVAFGCWLVVVFASLLFYLTGIAFMQSMETINFLIGISNFLVGFSSLGALFYVVIRLTFYLGPITIIDRRIDIGSAWKLGRGNFWRILGVYIVVVLPIGIFQNITFRAIIGSHPTPPPGSGVVALNEWFANFMSAALDAWYLLVPFTILCSPLTYGLFAACATFPYQACRLGEAALDRVHNTPTR